MGLDTVIMQWRDAERADDEAAKKEARRGLVTALWEAYAPLLKGIARQRASGQQSDILISAFRKFSEQAAGGKINATTCGELFVMLRRKIFDKVSERVRKDERHQRKRPIWAENELARPAGASDAGSGVADGLAQWAVSREPPPEFQAMIDEMLEALPDPRLREVLLLKIEHLEGSSTVDPELGRSNAEIARILRLSDREVGRRVERIRKHLAQHVRRGRHGGPLPA